jgi:hypothetical protein
MARKPLMFKHQEGTNCIVPVSHKLNADGYFRKRFSDGRLKMYHVYIWEKHNGLAPVGYEIHHTCGNRACCNPDHLECIDGHEHAVLGNQERYAERQQKAKEYWKASTCTGTHLASRFGVSFSIGCEWIRKWKMEGVETIPKGSRSMGEIPMTSEARGTSSHSL